MDFMLLLESCHHINVLRKLCSRKTLSLPSTKILSFRSRIVAFREYGRQSMGNTVSTLRSLPYMVDSLLCCCNPFWSVFPFVVKV